MMEYVVDGRTVDIVFTFQRHEFGSRHTKTRLRHRLDARIDKRSLLEDVFPDHQETGEASPSIEVEKIELRLKQKAMDADVEVTGSQMHVTTNRELLLLRYTRR